MLVIVDGKSLMDVCEVKLSLLRQKHNVEIVYKIDKENKVILTQKNEYEIGKIDTGTLKV